MQAKLLGWVRSSRGFFSIAVVVALVASTLAFTFGDGNADSLFDLLSGQAWLGSDGPGEMILASGTTGKGSMRLQVPGAESGEMSIVQRDGHAYVLVVGADGSRRLIRVDDATLTAGAAREVEEGQQVVRGGERAWLVHRGDGIVQPIDVDSLKPEGKALRFKGAIDAVASDEGVLLVIERKTAKGYLVKGARKGKAITLGKKGHEIEGCEADGLAVAVNATAGEVLVMGSDGVGRRIRLPKRKGELLVPRVAEGPALALVVRSGAKGTLTAVDVRKGKVREHSLQTPVGDIRAPLVTRDVAYLVDATAGTVTTVNLRTGEEQTSETGIGGGEGTEAFVKDGFLWVNDPAGAKAVVVDDRGRAKTIDKYDPEVPYAGQTAPPDAPEPPSPPQPAPEPPGNAPPEVSAPGMPRNLQAVAGNRQVTLEWNPPDNGGAPIDRYELSCTPDCGSTGASVPGSAASQVVAGLRNGREYRFRLAAVNVAGTGPAAAVGPVKPTGDVPATPQNVRARENPEDGTVTVEWDEADSEGLDPSGYEVRVVRDGVGGETWETSNTSFATPTLELDDDSIPEYTFTVRALARNRGSRVSSRDSTPSNAVDPYMKPGRPDVSVDAGDSQVTVTWSPVAANGRPVAYVVRVGGREMDQTAGTESVLSGLENGADLSIVVAAVNDAGETESMAQTVTPSADPRISIPDGGENGTTAIWFTVSVDNWGGGPGSCTVRVGDATVSNACSGRVDRGGLTRASSYTVTFTVTNAQGKSATTSRVISTRDPSFGITVDYSAYVGAPPPQTCGATAVGCTGNFMSGPNYVAGGNGIVVTHGDRYTAACQVRGEVSRDPRGRTSDVWNQVAGKGWINSINVGFIGFDAGRQC